MPIRIAPPPRTAIPARRSWWRRKGYRRRSSCPYYPPGPLRVSCSSSRFAWAKRPIVRMPRGRKVTHKQKDVTPNSSLARVAQPIGESSDADSASHHQLLAAIDAEDRLLATRNGVLALGAGLDCQPRVHDAAAFRSEERRVGKECGARRWACRE